ncbi:unnamed protein product [Schistosoma margrebowiei]|uniref:Uncharacterized protein n=1 Tax=Schistosoma margrebowiei TaxID=48269 RepID=A0A183MHR2_9TREM|nr:unnamed protein product [Schistosoma margrebowiei]
MQMKTTGVEVVSASVDLNIHKGKGEILKYNTENTNQITLDGETLEDVESFICLRSITDQQGGSDADVNKTISKARAASLHVKNMWNSKQLSVNQYQNHNLLYKRQDSSAVRS